MKEHDSEKKKLSNLNINIIGIFSSYQKTVDGQPTNSSIQTGGSDITFPKMESWRSVYLPPSYLVSQKLAIIGHDTGCEIPTGSGLHTTFGYKRSHQNRIIIIFLKTPAVSFILKRDREKHHQLIVTSKDRQQKNYHLIILTQSTSLQDETICHLSDCNGPPGHLRS